MLYYTGSEKQNEEQTVPSLSLGGNCSSTQIDNDDFGTIFEQIGKVNEFGTRYRLIYFRNAFLQPLTQVKFFIESGDMLNLEIAAVRPSGGVFEKINKDTAKPYQAVFSAATEENPIIADSLQPNDIIGIWFKATVKEEYLTKFDKFYNAPSLEDEETLELLQTTDQDTFKLSIKWQPLTP